jgi:putative transposase
MGVSPSAFYHWLSNRASSQKDVTLDIKATEIFNYHRETLGYRRLTNELRKEGFDVGYYKIWRLMSRLGLQARYPKRFKITTDSKHNFNIADNLLDRKFDVQQPNKYWTTDITYGVPGVQH